MRSTARRAEREVTEDLGGHLLLRAARDPAERVLAAQGGTSQGLTTDEAAARLARVGANLLPHAAGPSLLRQFVSQLTHFFAAMLWIASILAFVGGLPELGWAIIAVVVLNGAFSFAQEYRAERATRALSSLLPHTSVVVRDGHKVRVEASQLVPGDVIVVTEGDRISADARVLSTDGLAVDNSLLTGESEPRPRSADASAADDLLDADNLIFAGTYVTAGSARAVVLATGAQTSLGGIAHLTGTVARRPTPLRESLHRSVRTIALMALGCGMLFFGISLLLGATARSGFLFSVGVIVALVPEGLLPTLTLSLAMGATRMARRGALVRHLEAVETLGATTVICTDKTGTVTANQMTARRVAVATGTFGVTGTGYAPTGTLVADGRPLSPGELGDVAPLLHAAALCGDARVREEEGRWRCSGDPTEGALLVLARKGGVDRETAERGALRTREYPFDSQRQRMSTVHALPTGAVEVLVKGAPERILGICSSVRRDGGVTALDVTEEARIVAEVETMAADGLRVLALARRIVAQAPASADDAERELEFLGLVGMEDPVRPEVPHAIERCRRAGIRVIMITGDHPATAAAVARKAGLSADHILIGNELPHDVDDLGRLLAVGDLVIARAGPEQKLRIAEALQARGDVVAMTGDGVNDAPTLRRSDIGVAMGKAGTDVAREAADIVLLDDNFAHIVEAIEEGRSAFDNIKRFLTYHLTDNVAELAPFLAWALSAGRIPLMISVLQILALDIGTDLMPALALGAERPERGAMRRPPRARRARLLDRNVLGRAFGFLGPVEAVVAMTMLPLGAAVLYGWRLGDALPSSGRELATLSTIVFSTIVAMPMANAFECRSTPASLFHIGPLSNRLLAGAVVTEAAMLAMFVYLPPLRRVLHQAPLSAGQWVPALLGSVALIGAEEARKWVVRRRRQFDQVDNGPASSAKPAS